MRGLVEQANKVFLENFKPETCFERAIFYSWACKLDKCCTFCYMSTLPKELRTKERVRSIPSLLAETIICKKLGWDYGFLSGGIGVFSDEKMVRLLKETNKILGEKIWVNIGVLSKKQMEKFKPYIKGVVGTIEVLDPGLHKKICPSKPIGPVINMFRQSKEIGLKNAMTLIVGLGETIEDFKLLEQFIKENNISKIHIYGLNIQEGTVFEGQDPPTKEYQAEWIARTRIAFPKLDIQCGIWSDRAEYVCILLKAGANSISKFPALRKFGSEAAKKVENEARKAGRKFRGSLTRLPEINVEKEVGCIDKEYRNLTAKKLRQYLKQMMKGSS
ncbi:radical SAM protein [Candidatus Woesearchaeota archaeon]|nr:MAG: radical SAM protein [Candidatus Woesearchaeota archaeon]